MQWSDVTRRQTSKTLRQFGILCLVIFGGWAVWRFSAGQRGLATSLLAGASVLLGVLGLLKPNALQPIFTAWMTLAFPLGWLISRVLLAILYYGVFTPIGVVFRLRNRDVLRIRHQSSAGSYWTPKASRNDVSDYLRQF
jgi:hypothetical protein